MLKKILLLNFILLNSLSLSFGFNLNSVSYLPSINTIDFYFDSNFNESNLNFNLKNINFSNLNLFSFNLKTGSFSNLEYPYINNGIFFVPLKQNKTRFKLSIKLKKNLNLNNLKSKQIIFSKNNINLTNFNFSNLKFFQKKKSFDLNSKNVSFELCSFDNNKLVSCGDFFSINSNSSLNISIPSYYNNTFYSSISSFNIKINPNNDSFFKILPIYGLISSLGNFHNKESIVIYSENKLKFYDLNGSNFYNSSTINNLKSFSFGNFSNDLDSLLYITSNELGKVNNIGTSLINNNGGLKILSEDFYSSSRQYYYSNSQLFNFTILNNSNSYLFDLNPSWISSNGNNKCSIEFNLNKFGNPKNFNVSINKINYKISTNNILSNVLKISSDHSYDYNSIFLISNSNISYKNPSLKYNAKTCNLNLGVGYFGNISSKNLTLNLNSKNYNLNISNINKIDLNIKDYYPNLSSPINNVDFSNLNQVSFKSNFDVSKYPFCSLSLGINKIGLKKDLYLNLGSKKYLFKFNNLSLGNEKYKSFSLNSLKSTVSLNSGPVKYNLNKSLNSNTCNLKLGINYKGNFSNLKLNLTSDSSLNSYLFDLSSLSKNNYITTSYPNLNWNQSSYFELGKTNKVDFLDEIYISTTNLYNNLTDFGNCNLDLNLKYVSNGMSNNLSIFFNSKNYFINSSNVGTLNFIKKSVQVSCLALKSHPPISLTCTNCNLNNYFEVGLTNTSNGVSNSYFKNVTLLNYTNSFRSDPLIRIDSNNSLKYDLISKNILCSDLNSNISLNCINCNSNNDLNLISLKNIFSNNTYQNSNFTNDLDIGVDSKSSFKQTNAIVKFSCSNLNNQTNYLDFSCPSCDSNNYYNIPLFNSSLIGNFTLFNGSFVKGVPNLKISGFNVIHNSTASLKTSCSNLNNISNLNFNCKTCNSSDSFVLFNDLNSVQNNVKINNISTNGNLIYDVYSNSSLYYSKVSLSNLTCSILNSTINLTCSNCDSNNYYNLMEVNGSMGHSRYSNLSSILGGDLKISINKYLNLPGTGYLILDNLGNLNSYDSNNNLLWIKSITGFGYRNIYTFDLNYNYLGKEILYLNSSSINIYNTFGTLIKTLTGFKNPKLYFSNGFLFILNEDFTYKIFDGNSIIKSGKLNSIGFNFNKFIDTNIIPTTESNEIILETNDNYNTFFTIFDSQFNKITSFKYLGILNNVLYSKNYNSSLLFFKNSGMEIYPVNILSGFSIYLNNSKIYSTNKYISNNYNLPDFSSKLNTYLSSLSSLIGFNSIIFPLKFISKNLNSIKISYDLIFNNDYSSVIYYSNYSSLVNYNKLLVDTNYFSSGVKINYNFSGFPFKITSLNNLPNYNLGGFNIYNQNNNSIGNTCYNSNGSKILLGYTDILGNKIGCNLGYVVDKNRKNDYIMYLNPEKIFIKNQLFKSDTLNDYFITKINLNSNYTNKNFTNIILNNLNTSFLFGIYDKFGLKLENNNINYTLNYNFNNNCHIKDFILSDSIDDSNLLKLEYFKNNISNNKIYVCAEGNFSNFSLNIIYKNFTIKNSGDKFILFGEKNSRVKINNLYSSKSNVYWGELFNINGNYSDLNGDNVSLDLEFLNPITKIWTIKKNKFFTNFKGKFNFSGISLNQSFIGNKIYYRINATDIKNGNILGSKESNINWINIKKIPFNISKLDSGNTNLINMKISSNFSNLLINNSLCKFYVKLNSNYILYGTSFTNNSGICSQDLSNLNPSSYFYYLIVEKQNYLSTKSNNFIQTFKQVPDLLINLNTSYDRVLPLNIQARLIDSNNNFIFDSANCILSIDNKVLVSVSTNISTGICKFPTDLLNKNGHSSKDFLVGSNNLIINVSGLNSFKYSKTKFTINKNITLKDTANITIFSPLSKNYNPNDTIILNATLKDNFNNNINLTNGGFYWEYVEDQTGDKSIISSKLIDLWKIPLNVYGSVHLNAIFDNFNYGGKTIKSIPISVQDGLKIHSLTNSKLLRLSNKINKLEANLITGNDIPVNISNYNGTWSGYNCSWYLKNSSNNIFIGKSTTNSNGFCSFNFKTNCSYSINDYNLTVNLQGNINGQKYPVLLNKSITNLNLYDDLSNSILKISPLSNTQYRDNLTFGNEYILDYNFTDSCGVKLNKNLFNLTWDYDSNLSNIHTNLGIKNKLSLTPLSYMNGKSFISARILSNKYYASKSKIENISIIKISNIGFFNVPTYLVKNTINPISCGINIKGIINKSFYSAIINIDGINHSIGLNNLGIANYNLDTTGLSEGQHLVTCKILDYNTNKIIVNIGSKNFSSKLTQLPSNLKIFNNSILMSNREYDLTKSTPGNLIMPTGLNQDIVFRKGFNIYYEPENMYFGISFSTIGAPGTVNAGKEILLNGVNVTGYIYNNNSNNLISTLNCIQDLNKFNNRKGVDPKDLIDNYRKNYVCNMAFNPGNIPVGIYKIIINATMPGQAGWTSDTYINYFKVYGILNTTLIFPLPSEIINVKNNYNFKSNVKDEFGSSLNSNNVQVQYYLRDANRNCQGSDLGITSLSGNDPLFTLNQNIHSKQSYITDSDRTYNTWRIQARAFSNYYKTLGMRTSYNPQISNLCSFDYLKEQFFTENIFRPKYEVKANLLYPTNSVMAPDSTGINSGKLSFACKITNFDGKILKYVPVTLTCDNCASIPSRSLTLNSDSSGISYFYFNPNSSDFDKTGNFTCSINNGVDYEYGSNGFVHSILNEKRKITIVQQLGSGWGNLPANYTPPKFTKSGIFTDSACNNQVTWIKSSNVGSVYIGFSIGGGNYNLTDYKISKSVGSALGGTFDNTDNIKNYGPGINSVSECIKFTPLIKTNGVNFYKFDIHVSDSSGGGNDRTNLPLYVDDVVPLIDSVFSSKINIKPSSPLTFKVNLNPTTVNVDGFKDILTVSSSEGIGNTSYNVNFVKNTESNWTKTFNSPNSGGTYHYNFKVLDKAGYSNEKLNALSILVDGTSPSITTSFLNTGCNPSNILGSNCLNNVDFRLVGTDNNKLGSVSIRGSGSIGSILNVNNINLPNYDSGLITKDLSQISDGTYTITYTLTDIVGNINISTLTLIKKTSYPNMNGVILTPKYIKNKGDIISLNGLITEISGYNISSVKINGNTPISTCNSGTLPANSCNLNENIPTTSYSEGVNSINLTSSDNLGNTGSKIYTEILDTINPVVSITAPISTYLKGNFQINSLITDTNRDNANISYSFGNCNGYLNFLSGNNFIANNLNSISCGYGTKILTVSAYDKSGRKGSKSQTIIIDNILPVNNILYPISTSVIQGITKLNITVKEDFLKKVEYQIDNLPYSPINCLSPNSINVSICDINNFDTTSFSDGVHTLRIKSTDFAGNIKSNFVNFKIDNHAPLITLVKIKNGDGNFKITGNNSYVHGVVKIYSTILDQANEGLTSTYNCVLGSNNYPMILNSGYYVCSIPTNIYLDSTKIIKLVANDSLNHMGELNITLKLDNTLPVASNYNLTPNLIKTGDSLSFNFNVSEKLSKKCEVYFSNTNISFDNFIINKSIGNKFCSGSFNLNLGNMLTGLKYINIKFYDLAGNQNYISHSFYLDNSAPVINYFNLTSASIPSFATNNLPGVGPIDKLNWETHLIEDTGIGNISSVKIHGVMGLNINSSIYSNFNYISGNNYTFNNNSINYYTNGLLENKTIFELEVKDSVGNIAKKNFSFFISNAPPVISNLIKDKSSVELNYGSISITSNVSGNPVKVKKVEIKIIGPNNNNYTKVFNLIPSKFNSLNTYVFTPSISGNYDVEVKASNDGFKSTIRKFNNVFTGIGTTDANLTFIPNSKNVGSVYFNNDSVFGLFVNLTNKGFTRMLNTKISFASSNGILVQPSIINVGTLLKGSKYTNSSIVKIKNYIGNGNMILKLFVDWNNVDGSASSLTYNLPIKINKSNKLVILNSEVINNNLEKVLSQNLGQIQIRNEGNNVLNSISIKVLNGTINNSNIIFNYLPNLIPNLGINSISKLNISVISTNKGNFNGYFLVNSSCNEPLCSDSIFTNLTFYDKVKQDITQPLNNIIINRNSYLNGLPFNCSISSFYDSNYLINHKTSIILKRGIVENQLIQLNTSVIGKINYLINLTKIIPGKVSLICKGENNLNNYIRSSNYGNNEINLTIKGNLLGSINYIYPNNCLGGIYWYDSASCHNVNISSNVIDEFNYPVSNTNVTFYTNATNNSISKVIGNCITDNSGNCQISWNPSVKTQGNYEVFANYSKNKFYSNYTTNKNITIKGGLFVNIISPINSSLKYLNNYTFDLILKDINGNDITNSLNYTSQWSIWNLSGFVSNLSLNKTFNLTINKSFLGDYKLNLTIISNNGTFSDIKLISIIRDSINLTTFSTKNNLIRDSNLLNDTVSTNFSIHGVDLASNKNLSGLNISFLLDNILNIGNCLTDNLGNCQINWNPSVNVKAGYHNISIISNKKYFMQKNTSINNILVKIYVLPHWLSANTYSYKFNNNFNIPLKCEVLQYNTTLNPLDKFEVNYNKLNPAIFNSNLITSNPVINSKQYFFNSTNVNSIINLGINQGLKINFTGITNISLYSGLIQVNNLNLTHFDKVSVEFNNLSTGIKWTLFGLNKTGGYDKLLNSTKNYAINTINYSKAYTNIVLVLNKSGVNSVILKNIHFYETINKKVIKLGEPEILGNKTTGINFLKYLGDFENLYPGIGFNSFGLKVNSFSSSSNYSFDKLKSLRIGVNKLNPNEKFGFSWNPGNYDISNYIGLFFVGLNPNNVSLNVKVNFETSSCNYIYNLGNFSNKLTFPNINLSKFKQSCGNNIKNISVIFENNGVNSISDSIYLDRFEFLNKVYTNNLGYSIINFHPYNLGYYRFSCGIKGNYKYIVKKNKTEKIIKLIDTGSTSNQGLNSGGLSNSKGNAASDGSILSFETNLVQGNHIVPFNGKGILDNVIIYNLLSSSRKFNISSDNNSILKFGNEKNSSIIIELKNQNIKENNFNINLNSINLTVKNINLNIFITDVNSKERLTIPINLSFVNFSTTSNFTILTTSNIKPNNNLNAMINVKYNSTSNDPKLNDFKYNLLMRSNTSLYTCNKNIFNINSGLININCLTPFINNTSIVDLVLRTSFGGQK